MVDKVVADQSVEDARAKEGAIKTEERQHRLGNLYSARERASRLRRAAQRELAALRPMTSNRDLRQVVRTLGQETGTPGLAIIGLHLRGVQAESGILRQFIDHRHPNAAGHRIWESALAERITEMSLTR